MNELDSLASLVLAPYILYATALIGKERKVGGNQFRHAFATLGILLDYKYFSYSILLKASVIHDLVEEFPSTNLNILRTIDSEAPQVVDLVLEVTRQHSETKEDFLTRILEKGSRYAKILKVADRISNLTDLNRDTFSEIKMADYINQTEKYVVPMAMQVNQDMVRELADLIRKRREILSLKSLSF